MLSLRGIEKRFGEAHAVAAFDLDVAPGELVCLLGPSGSGKSTVLRMVGGFERPTAGSVLIDGQDMTRTPPERRPTSMMFQSHALWSHMTVAGNIGFGLRLKGLARAEVARRTEEALTLVGLAGLGARRTTQLSGGQQQRVALARSLVLEPKVLLLDEPFASLDQHLRERLREEVRDLQHRLGITMLFVTHGQDEALALADRIVVMQAGQIEQVGRPDRLYRAPESLFVAGFIGQMNLIEGEVRAGHFSHPALPLPVQASDGPAVLAIRPEALRLAPATDAPARLRRITDFGTHLLVEIDLTSGPRLKAMLPAGSAPDLAPGSAVTLAASDISLFRNGRALWTSVAPHG
jgi:putative spermidine/putrescine transport system ATP-binding protein